MWKLLIAVFDVLDFSLLACISSFSSQRAFELPLHLEYKKYWHFSKLLIANKIFIFWSVSLMKCLRLPLEFLTKVFDWWRNALDRWRGRNKSSVFFSTRFSCISCILSKVNKGSEISTEEISDYNTIVTCTKYLITTLLLLLKTNDVLLKLLKTFSILFSFFLF